MQTVFTKICIYIIGALFLATTVAAIWCYECNSNDNGQESCKNVLPDKNLLIDCREKKDGAKYDRCRTIRQWVDFKVGPLDKDERTIRKCGWNQTDERAYYYRAGFGGRQQVSTCQTDYCNDASQLTVTSFGLIMAAIVSLRQVLQW